MSTTHDKRGILPTGIHFTGFSSRIPPTGIPSIEDPLPLVVTESLWGRKMLSSLQI